MLSIRRVSGLSMSPTLQGGAIVVFRGKHSYAVGDILLVKTPNREVVKRVQKIKNGRYILIGDNSEQSFDSRHYGAVTKDAIIGSTMIVLDLPKAVAPPKLIKSYGVWLGRALAAFFAAMALVHLFRIDSFIPILDMYIPGGVGWATFLALVICLAEIFAIPFLLRMRLSPLAHMISGALVVKAPLIWFLLNIWSLGQPQSTGQLGQFVEIPATWLSLLFNLVWLGMAYYALWTLGYNRLKVRDLLIK